MLSRLARRVHAAAPVAKITRNAPIVAAKRTMQTSAVRARATAAAAHHSASAAAATRVRGVAATAARRAFSSNASAATGSDASINPAPSDSAADEQMMGAQLLQLVKEGNMQEAESVARADVDASSAPSVSSADKSTALRRLRLVLLMQNKFPEAEQIIQRELSVQQEVFDQNTNPETFLSTIKLLHQLSSCIRMTGLDPSDLTNVNTMLEKIYMEGVRAKLLAKNPSYAAALEQPGVYIFLCNIVGCYIDAQDYNRAKRIIQQHLLFDLEKRSPATETGSAAAGFTLPALRLASGLNFLGLAHWHDHSGCGGGSHANHHHVHDHSAATKAWAQGLEYTKRFSETIKAKTVANPGAVPVLSEVESMVLQASTSLLDNLSQAAMQEGDFDGAISYSTQVVTQLARCSLPFSPDLVAAQSQLLKTLLESEKMDDAELLCEELLKGFPHPVRTPPRVLPAETRAAVPPQVRLDSSRILDELSSVMFQFSNLDYAEKFLQCSLVILQARLQPVDGLDAQGNHPALARAYNGLGVLQTQMRDFASAQTNLLVALDMKLALQARGVPTAPAAATALVDGADPEAQPADDGLAEFYHNLGLAQLNLAQSPPAAGGPASLAEAQALGDKALANLLLAQQSYIQRFSDAAGPGLAANKIHAGYAGLLSQLSSVYRMRGDDAQALHYVQESLSIKRDLFTPHSPQLAADLYTAAFLLASRFARHAEAVPLYRQLVAISSKSQGSRPPDQMALGVAQHWLALSLDRSGETGMSVDSWRHSVECLEKAKAGPREVMQVARELARVLRATDAAEEAQKVDDKIATLQRKLDDMEAKQKHTKEAQEAVEAATHTEGAQFTEAKAAEAEQAQR